MTFYEILGVPKDALSDFIKAAYRRKISKHHSDLNGGNDEMAKEINVAYEVLINPEKRALYDETGEHDTSALDAAAQGMLIGKSMEWVSQVDNVDAHDMMAFIVMALNRDIQAISTNDANGRHTLDRLKRARRRIKYVGREKDLIGTALDGQIAHIESQLKRVAHDRKKIMRAIELSKDYRFELDAPMTATFHVYIGAPLFGR